MSITATNISKRFGNFVALDNVSIDIPTGELVALLGPSGSGKTTLLRIIAGLETADTGSVQFKGEDITAAHPRERNVGFVFQHYALFRHMTIFENIAFGLRVRPRATRPSNGQIRSRVLELLKLVQLENLEGRYPSQLSGGQRQRVALARALAVEPKVLLLDEPFGALDAKVRAELRRWLRRLHDEIHVTSVFVTHDQEEALEVSDRVAVLKSGRIEQVGSPEEIYHHPANAFVFDFLGHVNIFHGRVQDGRMVVGEDGQGEHPIASADGTTGKGTVFIRPHLLDITHAPVDGSSFKARIRHINPAGPMARVELLSQWGQPVQVDLTQERYRELGLTRDSEVYVTAKASKVFVEDYAI